MRKHAILFALFLTLLNPLSAQNNGDVILQAFTWSSANWSGGWYNHVNGKRSEIANAQFDAIYLPPPSQSTDPWGYIPEQHNNYNSNYGSENDLRTIISDMHNDGIKVVADMVLNHRNGSGSACGFSNPYWDNWTIVNDDDNGCGTGAADTGEGFDAARDLDHSNATLRSWLTGWMNYLRGDNGGLGFDGWRWDYAKGFSPEYVGEYNVNTNAEYAIGEYFITEGFSSEDPTIHRQAILDWISGTDNTAWAFDFTTRGAFIDAFKFGFERLVYEDAAPGILGVNPGRTINFIDNHDTGENQQAHWPFNPDNGNDIVPLGYAYILTHPGVPMVFWEHWQDVDYQSAINELIAIRKSEGINALSELEILNAGSGYYAAKIDEKVIISLGWNDANSYSPGAGWDLEMDEESDDVGYKIWIKSDDVVDPGDELIVHFYMPTDWSASNIHYWNVSPTITNSTWPGAAMTLDQGQWYTYTFPAGTTTASMVFNESDGTSGAQTVDVTATEEMWYYIPNPDSTNTSGHAFLSASNSEPNVMVISVADKNPMQPLRFWPNPCRAVLNLAEISNGNYTIYDVLGKVQQTGRMQEAKAIDVEGLNPGTYVLRIEGDRQGITRFIKQ